MNRVIPFFILLLSATELFAQDVPAVTEELTPVVEKASADAAVIAIDEAADVTETTGEAELIADDPEIQATRVAATPKQLPSEMPELFSARYLFQVVGSLFVVFICLFAVIYMLRRFNRMGPSSGTALRIIGSANVGQRERVVLLEAGNEQILLGVAPGSVRPLHVLAEPLVLGEGTVPATDFAAILRAANPLGGKS